MLSRLAHMEFGELRWRSRTSARNAWGRIRATGSTPAWDRTRLLDALADDSSLDGVRGALGRQQWTEAHHRLSVHFSTAPARFLLGPSHRPPLVRAIHDRFPAATAQAIERAENIMAGKYDLLGYRALSFPHQGTVVDWHRDPVSDRRAPDRFWSAVPYLAPESGDHKVIWELNRHQHWMMLGRAFWLTGDRRYRERCLTELASWLAMNPPLTGINWASMLELGFRSLSWLWTLSLFVDRHAASDASPWTVDLLLALDRQLTHVEQNLSYYFSPNTHLIGEGLALYVAGRALPELRRSPAREALGRRILLEESRRQISSDGGHCERSTHYHRYTLDFYLLALGVARITGDPVEEAFAQATSRLASAMRLLADDRGRLPHLGDDDGGMLFPIAGRDPDDVRDSLAAAAALLNRPDLAIDAAPEEAYWLLAHPRLRGALRDGHAPPPPARSGALTATGYYVSRSVRGDHMVVDGGVHGYLNGGHAHADALSLTLTVAGVPLLVDAGTGSYTANQALRDRMRSTAMHNTVVLDSRQQSVAKGPFNWSSTATGRVRHWRTHDALDYFEGAHDGYKPTEHRRHILLLSEDLLVVADLIAGTGSHSASVHWHVGPQWKTRVTRNSVALESDGRECQLVMPRGHLEQFTGDGATGLGWHAPVYGLVQPLTSLRLSHQDLLPFWMASVFGLNPANAVIDVEFVPVEAARDSFTHATALRIVRRQSTDLVVVSDPTRASAGASWIAGGMEADARVFFWRESPQLGSRIACIDGSVARSLTPTGEEPRSFRVEMPHRMPYLHVDLRESSPVGVET